MHPARFSGVRGAGADEHVWRTTRTDADEALWATGIVDLGREGGSSHGPQLTWPWKAHRVQELAGRARRRLFARYPDDAGSLPGHKNAIDDQLQDATSARCLRHRRSPVTLLDEVRRRVQQDTHRSPRAQGRLIRSRNRYHEAQ